MGAMAGRHIVFLVHGMGTYVDGDGGLDNSWHEDAKACMKACYEQYEEFTSVCSFEDAYEIVEINYDGIFNTFLEHWNKLAEEIAAVAPEAVTPLRKLFTGAGAVEDNFLWTHFGDVLFYRFAPTARHHVQLNAAKQIVDRLHQEHVDAVGVGRQMRPWSVLAHSLGTRVSHDALANLARHQADRGVAGNWAAPTVVAMLANVSRVIERGIAGLPAAYQANLRPGLNCVNYVSVCHRFDPFTFLDPFAPGGVASWSQSGSAGRYVEINNLDHLPIPPDIDASGDWQGAAGKLLADFVPHHFDTLFGHPSVHLNFFLRSLSLVNVGNDPLGWISHHAGQYEANLYSDVGEQVRQALGDRISVYLSSLPSVAPGADRLLTLLRALPITPENT